MSFRHEYRTEHTDARDRQGANVERTKFTIQFQNSSKRKKVILIAQYIANAILLLSAPGRKLRSPLLATSCLPKLLSRIFINT
jgi:hypothetical protein